ncbi:hypothetical protein ACHAWO_006245 [Cyclotella atomus]|uniref:Thioredoxin domain-containing protein n=1 Tax=Cyclotella atomus TaxID=382360 RepID=A0ABD3MWM1_9STRA
MTKRNSPAFCILLIVLTSACHLTSSFSCSSLSSARLDTALFVSDSQSPIEKTFGKGAWKPPSQNKEQQRGKVFSIQQPQDLLDFVVEDERLSVVKVFASWCKTCQVFDVRYRKLANQYSDKSDNGILQQGQVRFAEMQYDNPNNEEMCKLLNATKLPYIIMYKGSKGKVDEFQCGPGTFQVLVDKVREYADSEEEIALVMDASEPQNVSAAETTGEQILALQPDQTQQTVESIAVKQQSTSTTFVPDVPQLTPEQPRTLEPVQWMNQELESLKEQLLTANNEKNELFEIMKADLDWHKNQIEQLKEALQSQREQYEGLLRSRDGQLTKLEEQLAEEQKWFDREVISLTEQLNQVSCDMQQSENKIKSLESEVDLWQRRAEGAAYTDGQTRQLEEKVSVYESERNSLRKLTVLAVKIVWRGAGSLIHRVRGR